MLTIKKQLHWLDCRLRAAAVSEKNEQNKREKTLYTKFLMFFVYLNWWNVNVCLPTQKRLLHQNPAYENEKKKQTI